MTQPTDQSARPMPSAFGQAVLAGMAADGVQRQLDHLTDLKEQLVRQRWAWEAGGRGEQRVVQVLVELDASDWRVLADRRWPGTRRSNIDVIVVGPGGVFVIDVKNWREVTVRQGRLWRGDAEADEEVDKLLRQTKAVEEVLATAGLPPAEVIPLLVLAGVRDIREELGRVTLVGERGLLRELVRRGVRLTPEVAERLVECLDRECPQMPWPVPTLPATAAQSPTGTMTAPATRSRPTAARRDTVPGPGTREEPAANVPGTREGPTVDRRGSRRPATEVAEALEVAGTAGTAPAARGKQDALLSREELWETLVEAASREPIESWMVWLHPKQARLTGRRWSGPARIRGAAGTGKTVVALHRARFLAARGDRVLFTSLVGTLGSVNKALLARMAPEQAGRVEFTTVHRIAARCLRDLGRGGQHQQAAADTCFWRAWGKVGNGSALAKLGVPWEYWQDEVSSVIKGRGLTSFDQYRDLRRVGRITPLQPAHREIVWSLYECYERLRVERGVLDRNDVLLLARDVVRQRTDTGFDAVVVDEVQDLTCVGLQMLHAFVGDKPDGLLVVGDGQQSIYPGGFTLAEAGVHAVGRSTVLSHNYRNREAVLRYAQAVVAADSFDDLDTERERGAREIWSDRPGGVVEEVSVPDRVTQERELVRHIVRSTTTSGTRYGDIAVLVPTNDAARHWERVLARNGIPAMSLEDYDGVTTDTVKVGTYYRGKGLEFAVVYLPDRNHFPRPRRTAESEDAFQERVALERRALYVAITRARDGLWVGLRSPAPLSAPATP